MIPVLFDGSASAFDTFGVGPLPDAIAPHVQEELNGAYVLDMQYPLSGIHFASIQRRSIVLAKPNPQDPPQPFRITKISRPINGIVNIHAEHISYDLKGIPVLPFLSSSAAGAMQTLQNAALVSNPFTFVSKLDHSGDLQVKKPSGIRSVMGTGEAGILGVYGGEYHFDGYRVELLAARGADRGKVIRYGVDLIDLQQEENNEKVYSGVLPYWQKNDDAVYGDIQSVAGAGYSRILPVDVSSLFETKPTKAQVDQAGQDYIDENSIETPEISLSVKFAQLAETEVLAALQVGAQLGDTVHVVFDALGVNAAARIIQTDFDVLEEKYISVAVGDPRPNIADTIARIDTAAADTPTTAAMQQAIKTATDLITGVDGGNVYWLFDSTGRPTDLLFMDTEDPTTAVNVLRINRAGIGFSTSGVDGPFGTAWTIDGLFYASYIVAKSIVADKIGDGAAVERVIGSAAVTNGKIGNSAVSYGKTSFTGTLDQVGVNQANIATINGYITGSASFSNLRASNFYLNGRLHNNNTVTIGGLNYQLVTWQTT